MGLWRGSGLPGGLPPLRCTDSLQRKQSRGPPVRFTSFVGIGFVESPLEAESPGVFSAGLTRSLRSCTSWPVFFPGGWKGPLGVVWHEAWPAADSHKHPTGGRGMARWRPRLPRRSAEGLGLGSEHLETEESEWSAGFHLPEAGRAANQTSHSGHAWEERTPAS